MSCYVIYYEGGAKKMRLVSSKEEYMALRDSEQNRRAEKRHMVQMNYSCLPNEDGSLKGSRRVSNTVGMDIDVPIDADFVLSKKEELGLLMFENSATKPGCGHIVFRRHPEMSQEENLRWASKVLGVEYDQGAKDITRVFFTPADKLVYLDEELFSPSPQPSPEGEGVVSNERSLPSPSNVTKHSPLGGEGGGLFKGIEYSKIIERLLLAMGVDGKPEEGERNNYLYSLARELRYVTDFNEEKIISVLPDWGLPETEVRRTVASAVGSVRKKDVPQRLQRIIQAIMAEKAQMEDDSEEEEIPEELEIPHRLPRFFQTLIKAYPQEYKAAALLASLPCLGALASRVRSTYLDGSTHSPSFITCIVAPQASGKSFARHEFNLLTEPIKRADVIGREREREYQEKRKAAKNTKNQPEDPKAVIRLIPATASNAMILKRADYARGLHLLTFAEEIDTLTKGNKAGAWSQKSDLYRMAFDNAEWGQDYMSDNSYSGQVQLFYNLLVCGTPNAMSRFFNDVEDGLVSRVCFIKLPDMLGTKMPQFGGYRKTDKEYLKREIERIAAPLNEVEDGNNPSNVSKHSPLGGDGGGFWMESPKLSLAIDSWLDDKRMEYLQTQDNPAMDVFRRRAGVIGYRAGMICWALEGKMTKEGVDFALWVANYVLHNLLDLFGEAMNKAMTEVVDKDMGTQTKTTNLFSSLPNVFTKQDIVLAASSFKVVTPARKLVSRWKKAGLVRMIGKNRWEKGPSPH